MANITRIKASETKPAKSIKKADKAEKAEKAIPKDHSDKKKPFILVRPFVYLGRYIRDSWREIRHVRWPSRSATWKMVLAVVVYTALFIAIIMLLDLLFTFIFNNLLK